MICFKKSSGNEILIAACYFTSISMNVKKLLLIFC